MSKETTLLDYAMFIARERELCVQGLPSDEAGAVERFIAAADRELSRGDAIDISQEHAEKQVADVQMPVVAWVEPEYEDHFGCDSIQAYRSEKPGWEALVSQSDAQAALAAKDAEIDALKTDYLRACKTVAAMHQAATGRVGEAPWLGVVEDVAALKAERDGLKVDADRYRWLNVNGLFAQPHGYDTQVGVAALDEPEGILFINNICTHIASTAIDAAIAKE